MKTFFLRDGKNPCLDDSGDVSPFKLPRPVIVLAARMGFGRTFTDKAGRTVALYPLRGVEMPEPASMKDGKAVRFAQVMVYDWKAGILLVHARNTGAGELYRSARPHEMPSIEVCDLRLAEYTYKAPGQTRKLAKVAPVFWAVGEQERVQAKLGMGGIIDLGIDGLNKRAAVWRDAWEAPPIEHQEF